MMMFATESTATTWGQAAVVLVVALSAALQQFTSWLHAKQAREDAVKAQHSADNAAVAVVHVAAKTAEVAVKADALASQQTENAAVMQNKLGEIHILVNGQFSQALKEISDLKQRVASLLPQDKAAQVASEQATDAHERRDEFDARAVDKISHGDLGPAPPIPVSVIPAPPKPPKQPLTTAFQDPEPPPERPKIVVDSHDEVVDQMIALMMKLKSKN